MTAREICRRMQLTNATPAEMVAEIYRELALTVTEQQVINTLRNARGFVLGNRSEAH